MTQPRSRIVDPSVIRWYHCISRCVRRAFLFAENHLHLLLRIDPDVAQAWTPIKANITQDVQSIFDRLEMDAQRTLARVTNLLTSPRFYGSFMSATRATLRCVARKLGVKELANTA